MIEKIMVLTESLKEKIKHLPETKANISENYKEYNISEFKKDLEYINKQEILEPNIEKIKNNSLDSLVENNIEKQINLKEINNNGFRDLSFEEFKQVKEKTNMSDETLKKCVINEEGTVKLKCINEQLAGRENPLTSVEYKNKTVNINGIKVEGVFAEFDSVFKTILPKEKLLATDRVQIAECNLKLKEYINANPEFRKNFTEIQLKMIERNMTPRGFTWHHDFKKGNMNLVDTRIHQLTRHTGGKVIWGGGSSNR